MQHLLTLLPWGLVAILYVELGWLWLQLVMLLDATGFAPGFIANLHGDGSRRDKFSARVVAVAMLFGWPVFMVYGRINAWRTNNMEEQHD